MSDFRVRNQKETVASALGTSGGVRHGRRRDSTLSSDHAPHIKRLFLPFFPFSSALYFLFYSLSKKDSKSIIIVGAVVASPQPI